MDVTRAGQIHNLTHQAAQVTKLVMETLLPQAAGSQISKQAKGILLDQVKQLVYAAQPADVSLLDLLYSVSLEQAVMVKALCIDILQHHLLQSDDCFTILEAALQAGIPSLSDRALHVACANFKHVLVYNSSSWATLSKDTVLLILCSNNLQVAHEQEVLDALALWVKACPDERCSLFADMFVQAVRLHEMAYAELQLVDGHPLVSEYSKAYMQVAHVLLAWHIQKPKTHYRDQPRASMAWQTQSAHQQTTNSAADEVQSPTELQIAADGNRSCTAQQDISAGPSMQILAPQPSQGHSPSTQQCDEQHDLSEPRQQLDHPQQLSHCGRLHQLFEHECDSRQSGEHESEDDVKLSCSPDDQMESGLGLDCSAMSQLPAAVVSSAARTTHDKAAEAMTEIPMTGADLPRMPSLAVRTGHAQEAGNCASRSLLDHEMVNSPSARPAKKKQATPSSMRCLKF
ncbi:MAG: hypothetical protein FRX49_01173 [Trebouxia sp. A1-2]|nr:MAG: hypothetical protein FRX49_01173 [Trebouxia sp. A1-2]